MLLENEGSSFFYSAGWARVLCESYRYNPLYFALTENNKLMALLPFMEIKSVLTGKRAVSLPFTDHCEPLIAGGSNFHDMFKQAAELGRRSGWKYIELRDAGEFLLDAPLSAFFYSHTLDIAGDENNLFSAFRDSTRRNISKAMKVGVNVSISNSIESLREFCRLNSLTRKKHGLPPQPAVFFRKIFEHVIEKGLGMIALAIHKNISLAGGVFFHFGTSAVYKYGASDEKYLHFRANNLVMWEAIKWYCQNGYRRLSFGRTEPQNSGLRQFKNGWGAREKIIKYYRYDLKSGAFQGTKQNITGFHNKIFSLMPHPMLSLAGKLLYRHIG